MTSPVSIKKYRNSLKEFEQHIEPHFNSRYSLNGCMPSHNPMAWISGGDNYSKGVDADLIVIFADKRNPVGEKPTHRGSRKIFDSVAFSFNSSPESNGGMDVIFSFKKNGEITSSQSYPETVFRELIRRVNRTFRNDGVPESREDLMDVLGIFLNNEEFGIEPFDPNKTLVEILGVEGEHIEALCEESQEHLDRAKKDAVTLEKLSSEVDLEIDGSDEAKEIEDLQQKIAHLRRKMNRNRQEKLAERGANELRASISEARKIIDSSLSNFQETSKVILRRVPHDGPSRENVESWLRKHQKQFFSGLPEALVRS